MKKADGQAFGLVSGAFFNKIVALSNLRHGHCNVGSIFDSGVSWMPALAGLEYHPVAVTIPILPHLTFFTTKIVIRQPKSSDKCTFHDPSLISGRNAASPQLPPRPILGHPSASSRLTATRLPCCGQAKKSNITTCEHVVVTAAVPGSWTSLRPAAQCSTQRVYGRLRLREYCR